jgi:hypothetical protein
VIYLSLIKVCYLEAFQGKKNGNYGTKKGQSLLILVISARCQMLNFVEIQQFERFSVIWKITEKT